jgi:DNA-binding NarL/FixJ family response regulator
MAENLIYEQFKILVIEDYPLVLDKLVDMLRQIYPKANIFIATTAQEAPKHTEVSQFDLIIIDIDIPDKLKEESSPKIGLQLLKFFLENKEEIHINKKTHIVVQSTKINLPKLLRLKPKIDDYQGGGFVVAEKDLPEEEFLRRVDSAIEGKYHVSKYLGSSRLELKPQWIEVLKLAGEQALTNEQIAKEIGYSLRNISVIFDKIEDALDVHPIKKYHDSRVFLLNKARKLGLIE